MIIPDFFIDIDHFVQITSCQKEKQIYFYVDDFLNFLAYEFFKTVFF